MQPLRPLLRPARRVLVSPDGALNLVPFAALRDPAGHYLVRHYTFSYLTSGRDLLRLQTRPASSTSKRSAMVVANPDFGATTSASAATGERLLVYRPGTQTISNKGSLLAEAYFPPLPGSADEAEALKTLLPDSMVYLNEQATEATLKQANSPRILHIATHGFFLADEVAAEETRGLRPVGLEAPGIPRATNPMLRSGLALAGANRLQSGEDDGVLTALEAAALDLWDTQLVALSACDTGVGEVKNGEGVYGLRRALVLAGSETQVMSLWPVSDRATRDLMIEYYRRLQQNEGRADALQQVQLRMLNRKDASGRDYSHPYYWASFIQSGEWANLAGKR
jgi:CHAT domain-containing protein